jgi:predicted transcriptional regulator
MTTLPLSDLASFHHFVGMKLQSRSAAELSPEEVLQLWQEHRASLAAIGEGLADVAAGRTAPADTVFGSCKRNLTANEPPGADHPPCGRGNSPDPGLSPSRSYGLDDSPRLASLTLDWDQSEYFTERQLQILARMRAVNTSPKR